MNDKSPMSSDDCLLDIPLDRRDMKEIRSSDHNNNDQPSDTLPTPHLISSRTDSCPGGHRLLSQPNEIDWTPISTLPSTHRDLQQQSSIFSFSQVTIGSYSGAMGSYCGPMSSYDLNEPFPQHWENALPGSTLESNQSISFQGQSVNIHGKKDQLLHIHKLSGREQHKALLEAHLREAKADIILGAMNETLELSLLMDSADALGINIDNTQYAPVIREYLENEIGKRNDVIANNDGGQHDNDDKNSDDDDDDDDDDDKIANDEQNRDIYNSIDDVRNNSDINTINDGINHRNINNSDSNEAVIALPEAFLNDLQISPHVDRAINNTFINPHNTNIFHDTSNLSDKNDTSNDNYHHSNRHNNRPDIQRDRSYNSISSTAVSRYTQHQEDMYYDMIQQGRDDIEKRREQRHNQRKEAPSRIWDPLIEENNVKARRPM